MKEDAMENLMKMMDKLLENYDELVKDLHVSVMKYIENLWDKIYGTLFYQWNRLLQRIEPAFIELAHYVESIAYNMAKEFLGNKNNLNLFHPIYKCKFYSRLYLRAYA